MLQTYKRTIIITSIVALLPIVAGIYLWNQLPDVISTHFGFNNQVNGSTSKPMAVFGIPLACLAVQWFCLFITTRDPRKQNITPKVYRIILWIVPVLSCLVSALIYAYSLNQQVNPKLIINIALGVIFIIIGNYLPKTHQTYTIGIRTPWTITNQENWDKTHRLAGVLWMICGFMLVAGTVLKLLSSGWTIALVLIAVCIPVGYSYYLHVAKNL